MTKQLKGRHFSSDVEVIAARETRVDGLPSELFMSGLQNLKSLVDLACFLPGWAMDLSAPRYLCSWFTNFCKFSIYPSFVMHLHEDSHESGRNMWEEYGVYKLRYFYVHLLFQFLFLTEITLRIFK